MPALASRTRVRLISACGVEGPRGVLAHEDALGVAARIVKDARVDQPVDDQHVGLLHALQRLEGEEVGIAGAAADEGYAAGVLPLPDFQLVR